MNDLSTLVSPVIWLLAALSFVTFVMNSLRPNRGGGLIASLLLLAGTGLLAASLAVPAWLPAAASNFQADGSLNDPRVISAWLVALAALASFLLGIRSLRIPALGLAAFWLPGVVIGGLVAVGGYTAGLRSSSGIVGLFLGGLALGTAVQLAARRGVERSTAAMAMLAAGASLVVIAAMVSLHGARAPRLAVIEGTAIDTLGQHVAFVSTTAPHDSLRRMRFAVGSKKGKADSLTAEVLGRTGPKTRAIAGGSLFNGPLVVPIALEEMKGNPHGLTWIKKGESVAVGSGSVTFKQFRFVMGEPIKLFADLAVTHGGRTDEVSPGMTASAKGEAPFPVTVDGFGQIAVAAVDADNGRVGLLLPGGLTSASAVRTVLFELRLRPLLPLAWAGAAVALIAFLLTLAAPEPKRAG